jgi:hypothetical protein
MSQKHQQSCVLPLKILKVTKRNGFIHMILCSRCVDIVMLCEVYSGDVCYLFYFKFFCDTSFLASLVPFKCDTSTYIVVGHLS